MLTEHSEYKAGMPVMLECFATWCGPCRRAVPHLAQLTKEYPNVYIISVSREEKQTVLDVKNEMEDMNNYNVAVDESGTLNEFMQEQSVKGIPHSFLFSGDGKLQWQGHPMDQKCVKMIKRLSNPKSAEDDNIKFQEKFLSKFTMLTEHSEYKAGMPVLLECFATWCGPCRRAVPHLAKMTKDYPNLYIISVSREEKQTVEDVKSEMEDMNNYNLAVDESGTLNAYMDEEGVEGIPHSFLFAGDGKMQWQGHPMTDECEENIRILLGMKSKKQEDAEKKATLLKVFAQEILRTNIEMRESKSSDVTYEKKRFIEAHEKIAYFAGQLIEHEIVKEADEVIQDTIAELRKTSTHKLEVMKNSDQENAEMKQDELAELLRRVEAIQVLAKEFGIKEQDDGVIKIEKDVAKKLFLMIVKAISELAQNPIAMLILGEKMDQLKEEYRRAIGVLQQIEESLNEVVRMDEAFLKREVRIAQELDELADKVRMSEGQDTKEKGEEDNEKEEEKEEE